MNTDNDSTDNRDEPATHRMGTRQGDESIITRRRLCARMNRVNRLKAFNDRLRGVRDADGIPSWDFPHKDSHMLLFSFSLILTLVILLQIRHILKIGEKSSILQRMQDLESENLALQVEVKRLVELHQAGQNYYRSHENVVEKDLVEHNTVLTDGDEPPVHLRKEALRENYSSDDSNKSAQQNESGKQKNDEESITTEELAESKIKSSENQKTTLDTFFDLYLLAFICLGLFFIFQLLDLLKTKLVGRTN